MSESARPTLNKLPFIVADVLLVLMAFLISFKFSPGGSFPHIAAAVVALIAGGCLGVLPFVLEYRSQSRLAEAEALSGVISKLQQVELVAAKIEGATGQWDRIHSEAGKAVEASKQIAERMTAEVQAFGDFMQRVNDNEKANLRVEIEKLRRSEGDWVQVLVRMLDHVYALHQGALRSGQSAVIEQVSNFQSACRDAARRIGLLPFLPNPGDKLDLQKHQVLEGGPKPSPDSTIADVIATGFTYQGRLIRPSLVRLSAPSPQTELSLEQEQDQKAP